MPATDRPLRVCAVVDSMRAGGAELLLAELARAAPSVGVELVVASLDGSLEGPAAARLRAAGVEPATLPIRSLLHPGDVRAVRRWLRSQAPDLVHTHLGYSDVVAGLAARSLGLPAISTLHAESFDGPARERAKQRTMAAARRHCAVKVIAVSSRARSVYLERGWDRPERVVAIPNGIAAEPRPGAGARVRAELGIAADSLVVATLSTLRPEKAHRAAIAALAELAGRVPRLRLLVAGDGPERAALEEQARALGLAGVAVFAGHREDVMEVLDAADVLLHPSRTDALPTALLEAMAASLPVVATRVGGIPEVVEDGVTGVLVEPPPDPGRIGSALAPLLDDPGQRERLGAKGRARYLARFTAEKWALRIRAVYDEVAAA